MRILSGPQKNSTYLVLAVSLIKLGRKDIDEGLFLLRILHDGNMGMKIRVLKPTL